MTTIKLTKETNIIGQTTYKIVDQDNDVVGTYSAKPEADLNFKRIKAQLDKFGNLKATELIEGFTADSPTETNTPKTEET